MQVCWLASLNLLSSIAYIRSSRSIFPAPDLTQGNPIKLMQIMMLNMWISALVTFTVFHELHAQQYDAAMQQYDCKKCRLAAFPTDIPTEAKEIKVDKNEINTFPDDAFQNFFQLEKLSMGNNPFTELPNLRPVGNTLKALEMFNCRLTELNASIINELVVLEILDVHMCRLTSLPNVPGPGNTLRDILCRACDLSTFPLLSEYRALENVNVHGTPITSVSLSAVASLHLHRVLKLYRTRIQSLPEYPMAYENIITFLLSETSVSIAFVWYLHVAFLV